MVKAIQALHLYPNKANDNDLVNFFSVKVEQDETSAVEFWKTLGFTHKAVLAPASDNAYTFMFKLGPKPKYPIGQNKAQADTPTHVSTEMQIIKEG